MIIPLPKFEPVEPDLRGMSWLAQFWSTLRNPPQFRIVENWIITLDCGLRIIIPKGFVTDGASIPRLLWFLISPVGPLFIGAILHDFGYQYGYLLSPYTTAEVYNIVSHVLYEDYIERFGPRIPVYVGKPQAFFDDLLRHVTIETSGATLQAKAAHAALSLFGGIAWGKYRAAGPTAYNDNSLGLPGVTERGAML